MLIGYTEHSIAFIPNFGDTNKPKFGLANSNPQMNNNNKWDAPYRTYFEYDFNDMFVWMIYNKIFFVSSLSKIT